ncbi:50S ribosomal protein L21 [Parathermosynechococcus lividus]
MAYAIIETGGKQLRVEAGRFYDVERLALDPDSTIDIEQVLLVQTDAGVHVGQPYVSGAVVTGTVLQHRRAPKVIVYKMKPKKKTRKKQGHRQELTRIMINEIRLNGEALNSSS